MHEIWLRRTRRKKSMFFHHDKLHGIIYTEEKKLQHSFPPKTYFFTQKSISLRFYSHNYTILYTQHRHSSSSIFLILHSQPKFTWLKIVTPPSAHTLKRKTSNKNFWDFPITSVLCDFFFIIFHTRCFSCLHSAPSISPSHFSNNFWTTCYQLNSKLFTILHLITTLKTKKINIHTFTYV